MSEETVALLREHKRQQAEVKMKNRLQYVDYGLVFAQAWEQVSSEHSVLGWPLCRTTVGGQLDKYCRASGVKRITVHGLRHTSATLYLAACVPEKVVQERLGHQSAAMTNMYMHVLPSMQEEAASRFATLLCGSRA